MSPIKLADTLKISLEEANMLFKTYAEAFPKLNNWLESQAKFAVENMQSRTFAPCNRVRWYPELWPAFINRNEDWRRYMIAKGSTERNGMNQPIQGTGADICKEALVEGRKLCRLYNEKYNAEVAVMVATVHDEIDFEVREDVTKEFADIITAKMIEVGNKYVSKVNMLVETTITNFWTK